MASFRNIEMSPDSSVKQGSRIVHPIYARHTGKDGQEPEDAQACVSESPRNITPTNFPVKFRLSNTLRSFDHVTVTSSANKTGYCRQRAVNNQGGQLDSTTESEGCRNTTDQKSAGDITATFEEHLATAKDNITEKNKKSSIEQKRFYQRKLTGFSPIKLLPVGKLFKFLRPPLQRRNSCPVLSISELEAEAKLNQVKSNPSEDIQTSHSNNITNEQIRNCRLTKWTSHQELQCQEDSSAEIKTRINDKANLKIKKHLSFKEPNLTSSIDSDHLIQNRQFQITNADLLSNQISNSNQDHRHSKDKKDSSVIEKTVIIVSENSTLIPNGTSSSLHVNDFHQPKTLNLSNGVSISMSNTLQDLKCEKSNSDSKPKPITPTGNRTHKEDVNNITIFSSDSEQDSSSSNSSQYIQLRNGDDEDTFLREENKNHVTQTCVLNANSFYSEETNCNNDINNKILLKFQNIEKELDNTLDESNPLTAGNKSETADSRKIYINDKSEFIKITPTKVNNILYSHDSVKKNFSTFKSEPKPNTTITIQNKRSKLDETRKQLSDKYSNENSDLNPLINSPLISPRNHQNVIKLQNSNNRKIYLPAEVTKNEATNYFDHSSHAEADNFNNISSEFQRIFEKITSEKKIENGLINCDKVISFPIDKSFPNSQKGNSETKILQPQLISITCSKTTKINSIEPPNKDNSFQNSGITVSVVNGSNSTDALDFGESTQNSLPNELQSADINECYNVKLDAPEEVIVAGFHDFCHTMLSLEESLESHDTGTVKRKVKPKIRIPEDKNNYASEDTNKIFNSDIYCSQLVKEFDFDNENVTHSLENIKATNNHASDKLLKEIQNSKSLEKMNIKDPDVIDAIAALDNSLREASEQPTFSHKELSEIESGLLITKLDMGLAESKKRSNVVKEDKIQCDNLIEEVLLNDTSKRVLNSTKRAAPPPPPKRDGIAIRILNSNTNVFSPSYSQNSDMHPSEIKGNNIPQDERYNDIKRSNFNETVVESNRLSQHYLSIENTKKINIMPNSKDDSPSLLKSASSDAANPTLPLQVSVENNSTSGLQDIVACNRTSPCSVDSGTSSHNQGYFVVVAIDFGTTYSGYAFSFTRDPDNIHMMKKWDGGDPGVSNQKIPTTLLLSPGGSFHSFGFSARDYYHDLDVEEAKGWLYFEKFKMTLHHSEHLSLDTEIMAANGKQMPAVIVFSHALRYFKDHALQELSDQSATRILNEDVRWVVTVPAIWKQPAKQFMRAAAYKAGIASPEYPDQLLIALEPEVASIYCRKMRLHQLVPEETQYQRSLQWQKDVESENDSTISDKDLSSPTSIGQGVDSSFTKGTRYMVVDCGGGTVDITVHELLDKQGTLKELQKASGGPYGSMGVDMEFENFLYDIFGKDFMQQFKSTRPTGYVDLMIAFEARKRNASPYKNNPLNISLPFSFIEFYKKYKGSSVESAIKKSSHKNIKWSQGMLRLEPSAMEALFHKTIEQIRRHIEDIINQENLLIDFIFLVGGFAESLILQKEIKEAFSSKLRVVIPQGVSLAILKGAVLFGLDPTTVNIRRLRMTYGVGVLNQFIHGVHPREKLVIKNGKQWCADIFDKFVVNEQSVGVGDVVVRRYTPAKDGQSCSVIHIYCSEKNNIYFITDPGVKRCATLILDLSDSRYIQSREIQTRMMFGDTEIKVSALDVTTGKCVKAEIDFLNH